MSRHIGKKYNSLTVLSINRVDKYTQANGITQRITYFNCLCDCGKETIVRGSGLNSQKSCGCAKTLANSSRALDVSGKVYSRLTAIKKISSGEWECLCECGSTTFVSVEKLNNGNTKSCGCLQKDTVTGMMLEKHRQKRISVGRNPDIPLSSNKKLERSLMSEITPKILARDEYTCAWCSQLGGSLAVHHIEPWTAAIDRRFDRDNLVTLCKVCHLKVHNQNFFSMVLDEHMSILLSGFVKFSEEAHAARLEISAG
jgi:5-methylcytosine-specific restriction endonuclease McrA